MSACRSLFSLLMVWLLHGAAAAAPLEVVASIKPLQLLVAAIGGERVDAQLLLDPAQSPHHYQLRPSERRQLQDADAVVWIGPAMETFLRKPLSQLPPTVTVLRLHHDHPGGETEADHRHEHDAHIWLSPVRAVAMARDIARLLASLQPAAADYFEQRAERFAAAMAGVDRELARLLAPHRRQGFIVLHPAYDHFVDYYGLNQVGAVTASPELPAGAARIRQLREAMRMGSVVCVVREPQLRSALLETVVGDSDVAVAILDPLAGSFAVEDGAFVAFFQQFGRRLARCLEG